MRHARIVVGALASGVIGIASACSGQSPASDSATRVFSVVNGAKSRICVRPAGDAACHPLTSHSDGWASGGVISPDGKYVAYSSASGPLTKSEVWVSGIDGRGAHRVSGSNEDALMPAFGADRHTLFYARSGAFGHASPIASSRRHQFNVVMVAIDDNGAASGAPNSLRIRSSTI